MTATSSHENLNGIRSSFNEVSGHLHEAGREAADSATKVAHELGEAGKSTLRVGIEQGKKQISTIEDYVREYPMRSLLIGAAIGAVVSRLFKAI